MAPNNQAQMVMLMNYMKNLQNQAMKTKLQKPNTSPSDPMQVLMNQMKTLQGQVTKLNSQPQPEKQSINASDPMQMMMTQMLLNGVNDKVDAGSPCIWVTGIPEEFRDADVLCNIFGSYGNVRRIAFSAKTPDGALIELDDPKRARLCRKYLSGIKLGGQVITVKPTRIDRAFVNPNKNEKSRDFKGAKRGRFNQVPVKDASGKFDPRGRISAIRTKRLSWPTPYLLVSRIPEGKVDAVRKYIIESGYTVKEFEERKSGRPEEGKKTSGKALAFVELASAEEAISAVGKLHNTMPVKIGEKTNDRGLWFTFITKKESKNSA